MEHNIMTDNYYKIIMDTIIRVFDSPFIKAIPAGLVAILSFLLNGEHLEIYIALIVLLVIDYITGTRAAKKVGEVIYSRGFFRTASKFTTYFSLAAAAHVSEHALPFAMLDDIILGYLVATELWSIIENADKMGVPMPPAIKALLKDYLHPKQKK